MDQPGARSGLRPWAAPGPAHRGGGFVTRLRTPDSYGLVLGLIVVSLLVDAVAPDRTWVALLAFTLRSGLLLFVLHTSQAGRRTIRWATAAVGVGFAAAITDQVLGAQAVTVGLEAVLVAVALAAIARRIGRYPRVDGRTILGALCIYLLIAMLAASVFLTMDLVTEQGFFVQGGGTRTEFLYFSLVTLTTLGYGDLTPAGDLARMLAVIEALVGQLYLVTVVALIVGNLGQERHSARRSDDGSSGSAGAPPPGSDPAG